MVPNWYIYLLIKKIPNKQVLFDVFIFKTQANYICKYADGSTKGIGDYAKLVATYGDNICPQQSFRTCADIKIEPNPDLPTEVYKPNPVKPLIDSPKVFSCRTFGLEYDQKMSPMTSPNMRQDPYKFIGSGLFCTIEKQFSSSCDVCRENCMSPDKVCPEFCYCRWFVFLVSKKNKNSKIFNF